LDPRQLKHCPEQDLKGLWPVLPLPFVSLNPMWKTLFHLALLQGINQCISEWDWSWTEYSTGTASGPHDLIWEKDMP